MNAKQQKDMFTLASYLDQMVKDAEFCLTSWYGSAPSLGGMDSRFETGEAFLAEQCGTTACAVGFMPRLFPEEVQLNVEAAKCQGYPVFSVNGGEEMGGITTGMEFFGLDDHAACWAFTPTKYREDSWPQCRHGVAHRLRVLARNGGEVPQYTDYTGHQESA